MSPRGYVHVCTASCYLGPGRWGDDLSSLQRGISAEGWQFGEQREDMEWRRVELGTMEVLEAEFLWYCEDGEIRQEY
jgi:hypothetical protein